MKKQGRVSVLMICLLVLSMAFVSCDNDGNNGGSVNDGGGSNHAGRTIRITGIDAKYDGMYAYYFIAS